MEYISCTKPNSNKIVNMTLEFWIVNSQEHISVILDSQQKNGISLPESFRNELSAISEKLSEILTEVKRNYLLGPRRMIMDFLNVNRNLISVLERIKFEVVNGMPQMYQSIIHMIYEQEYISEIFRINSIIPPANKCPSYPVIIFNSPMFSGSVMYCICSSLYFWSIIAAEHSEFLMNLIPIKINNFFGAENLLNYYRSKFNNICYIIAEIRDMTSDELYAILQDFCKYSNSLLSLIYEVYGIEIADKVFDSSPEYPNYIIKHIAKEHSYIKVLCNDFEKSLMK